MTEKAEKWYVHDNYFSFKWQDKCLFDVFLKNNVMLFLQKPAVF
jgi:hypothetical protein